MTPSGGPFAAFLWEAAAQSVETQPVACSWYIQDFQACWMYGGFGIVLECFSLAVCRSDSNPTKCQEPVWYFWDYSVGGGVLLSLHTVTEVLRNTFVSAEQQLGCYLCHPTNKEEGEEEGHQPGMGCT